MSRFRKAFGAALAALAATLTPFLVGGLSWGEVGLVALATVAAGLGAFVPRNAGFVSAEDLRKYADLAEAAYERYREVRGGVAYDGSVLPTWTQVESTVQAAWVEGQKAAVESKVSV